MHMRERRTGAGRAAVTAVACIGLVSLAGCSSKRAAMDSPPAVFSGSSAASRSADGSGASGGAGGANRPIAEGRSMRITVETTVLVSHRDAAVRDLRATVARLGGYVGDGSVYGADVGGSATFTVKVPAARVDDLRASLAGLGDVRGDSEKAEDVTEARADLKARLHNARAQEQRLLELLGSRTGNLADVILVEKELAAVRETIERFDAEDRTLDGQVSFATMKVVVETVAPQVEEGPGAQLAMAAHDGMHAARSFVLGSLTFALAAGPTLLLVAALGYALFACVRALVRRRRVRGALAG